jgi:D-alanyl-D-alanine carboxypeptidase/D-alanyl-D-alanine-endopeptidase (penicillin-binding protein 4)
MRASGLRARAAGGAEGLISRAGLSGQVACAVADAKTGLRLESVRGDVGLPPASVAKALTTLYALDVLGADYRFRTRLFAAGPLRNGVLDGDLILVGGGDPTLDTDHLAEMAADLKNAGIREVRGAFRVNDAALPRIRSIDADQPDHLGYSPAVSGIALNFNRVHFEWKPAAKGYLVTMDARTGRFRPEVQMATMRVADRNMPIYTYADRDDQDQWTVAGSALGKGGARWLPVRKPGLYAGDVFRTLARSHGIILKDPVLTDTTPSGAEQVVIHNSDPLQAILKDMLKYSTNITAEMVGMTATTAHAGRPVSLNASADQMSKWAAQTYGMTGTRLVDHSGLGDASRMTAEDLVGALIRAHQRGILRPLLKSFDLRDEKGRVNKSHPLQVFAKTGTLNFVSGLGGFLTAPDGTELAFAIFSADATTRASIPRSQRELPPGARSWNRKAKILQQHLIERWGAVYGS